MYSFPYVVNTPGIKDRRYIRNEKNKSSGAGTDHDSVWCGICKGNAGGSEGECSAGKVIR